MKTRAWILFHLSKFHLSGEQQTLQCNCQFWSSLIFSTLHRADHKMQNLIPQLKKKIEWFFIFIFSGNFCQTLKWFIVLCFDRPGSRGFWWGNHSANDLNFSFFRVHHNFLWNPISWLRGVFDNFNADLSARKWSRQGLDKGKTCQNFGHYTFWHIATQEFKSYWI